MIRRDPAYISHGEIQTGLAVDATHWAGDLGALYADDFLDMDHDQDILVARDAEGAIIGFAIVAWEETPRRKFAVLEDMAVDPARRSAGIGGGLVDHVEARVRAEGREWLFLESGLNNHNAHHFFEKHGFTTISHVFGKQLAP